ncbi:hypothetical protein B7463_g11518, partial [Scytalidium lignicola]
MSTRSSPSATLSDDGSSIGKRTDPAMLAKYLTDPLTITEKLVFPQSFKTAEAVITENKSKAKEFLDTWQVSWENEKRFHS